MGEILKGITGVGALIAGIFSIKYIIACLAVFYEYHLELLLWTLGLIIVTGVFYLLYKKLKENY